MATCPSGHESASGDFCDVCGVLIGAAPSLGPGLDPDAGPPAGSGLPGSGPADGTDAGGTVIGAPPRWSQACPRCGAPRDGQFCESCGHNFAAPESDVGQPAPAPPPPPPGPAAAAAPSSVAQLTDPQATFDPWPAVSRPVGPVPGGPVPGGPGPGGAGPDGAVPPAPGSAPAAPGSAPGAPDGAAWTAVVSADRAYYDMIHAAGGPDAAGIEFPAYSPQRRFPLDRAEIRIGRHSASSGISPEIDLSVAPADPGISRLHAVLLRAADGSWAIVDPGSANGTMLNGAELTVGEIVPVHDGDRIHLGAWTELRLTCGPERHLG